MPSPSERFDVAVPGGVLATFRLAPAGPSTPASVPAPPVVAVHGITANSMSWLAVARALQHRATVLAPDLRGRGRSNALPGPYGLAAHARDVIAVLDHFELEQAVMVGHSMGAYVLARLAVEYPDRVAALVLVDGGLSGPLPPEVDPQQVVDAVLGPAMARLQLTFARRADYHDWWRRHPAFAHGDVADEDLVAYADHDLTGQEPELRSSVAEAAVRGDVADLPEMGEPAHRMQVRATLLSAERGLLDEPSPMQPPELVEAWAAESPAERLAVPVPDVNHYTLVLGRGAPAVAGAVISALASAAAEDQV
jgi:pimeloyl-ACP methyl ester carboxylesterase